MASQGTWWLIDLAKLVWSANELQGSAHLYRILALA